LKAGHWITLKHPQMFAQAVRDFITPLVTLAP
jgi:hypothetical protein